MRSQHLVLAFLKRRWILLSCAIVLLAGSMCDFVIKLERATTIFWFGIANGSLCYSSLRNDGETHDVFDSFFMQSIESDLIFANLPWRIHRPKLGELADERRVDSYGDQISRELALPLWLPLSTVLGWIVFRELRWREKRAMMKSASEACAK